MKKKIRVLTDTILGTVAACVIYAVASAGTGDLLNAMSGKPVLETGFYAAVIWMGWRAVTLFFIWEDGFDGKVRRDKMDKEAQERREADEFYRNRNRVN